MNLDVKNVAVSLAGVNIVNNISLKVKERQFVGILGPNGCGKSTLLKSIYKVITPQQGSIMLNGTDVIRAPNRLISKNMSVVGQFNEMSFDFTVYEMVLMGRTPHKKLLESDSEQDAEIVGRALEQVNLTDYAGRSYMSLSGGEKQRVVLARALAQQPQFLILDEPTNHLDIKYQIQILSIVKNLNIGTLAALHDLTLAAKYCDYLYIIKQGAVCAEGEPRTLLTKELVRSVYDVDCEIYENPVTGNLAVAYL
jgi:iron complex transport system ATP-binding protein